ncbi:MAG: hypothetical protein P8J33_13145, partial [Pirellulaceae bacterium]|nr:hypothetical protein [Pirellulaceae bacterium]
IWNAYRQLCDLALLSNASGAGIILGGRHTVDFFLASSAFRQVAGTADKCDASEKKDGQKPCDF